MFHLCEVSRIGKVIEMESGGFQGLRGVGMERERVLLFQMRKWKLKKVLYHDKIASNKSCI